MELWGKCWKTRKTIDNISNNDKISLSRIGIIRIYAFLLNSGKTARSSPKSEIILTISLILTKI